MNRKRYAPCLLAALLVLTLAASLLGWDTLVMPRRYALSATARAAYYGFYYAKPAAAIYELQFYGDAVWFLRGEDYGLGLYRFRPGGVWFSDVYANRLCRFSALRPQDGFETVFQSGTRLIDVSAGKESSAP